LARRERRLVGRARKPPAEARKLKLKVGSYCHFLMVGVRCSESVYRFDFLNFQRLIADTRWVVSCRFQNAGRKFEFARKQERRIANVRIVSRMAVLSSAEESNRVGSPEADGFQTVVARDGSDLPKIRLCFHYYSGQFGYKPPTSTSKGREGQFCPRAIFQRSSWHAP